MPRRRRRRRRPPRRPGAITTMAVLSFIVGGLGLLCTCGAASDPLLSLASPAGAKDPGREAIDFMKKEVPGYLAIQSTRAISILVLSIAVVVVGAGLLKMQPWGRWLAILYGVVAFLAHLIYLIFQVAVIFPAQDKFFLQAGGIPGNAAAFHTSRLATVGLVFVIFCGHALSLLIVMLLPAIAAAFAPRRSRDEEELDEDMDGDIDRDEGEDRDDDDDRDDQRYRRSE
ncbi:MAG TPA: hypothetical protein VKS79_04670 [Gemmataceae bacterium]|nr:hypothetical protein [Gemmataceae bacterium]